MPAFIGAVEQCGLPHGVSRRSQRLGSFSRVRHGSHS
jgi:hypothetical protein